MTPELLAQIRTRRAAIASIDTIFQNEFSTIAKAVMAPTLAGLLELIKRGEWEAAKLLVNNISSPPPGVTEARMSEVKTLILAIFP